MRTEQATTRLRVADPARNAVPDASETDALLARIVSTPRTERGGSVAWLRWTRSSRRALRELPAALAVGCTLGVLVLALGLLRPGSVHQPIPAGAQRLASMLSVLRRPQTDADTFPSDQTDSSVPDTYLPAGDVVPGLTRLAVSVPTLDVFLIVQRPTAWPNEYGLLWNPRLGDQVGLHMISTVGGPDSSLRAVPAADLYRHDQECDVPGFSFPGKPAPEYCAEIVPDGVARIAWIVRTGPGANAVVTIQPTVRNNIAFAKMPTPVGGFPVIERDVWYDQTGQVIPERTQAKRAAVAETRRFYQPDADVLHRFPVFSAPRATLTWAGVRTSPMFDAGRTFDEGAFVQLHGAQARSVSTASGAYFSVVPTRLGACLVPQQGPGGGMFGPSNAGQSYRVGICSGSVASLMRRGIWKASGWDSRTQTIQAIYGIVPDTNSVVTLRLRGGSTRTVPVIDGVFIAGWTGLNAVTAEPVLRVTAIEVRSATGKLESWPFSVSP